MERMDGRGEGDCLKCEGLMPLLLLNKERKKERKKERRKERK